MTVVEQSIAPLIPRKILFGNPERAAPRISPDGQKIAYLAPLNGVLNVWVRTIGENDDRAITNDAERPIRAFFWQPGGRGIVHIQDQKGDENFHVFLTDVKTGTARDLTPYPGARADILDVDRNFPDEMLVTINNRDERFFDVHRINFKTGESILDTENPGDVLGWVTDNGMVVRVAQVMLPDGGTLLRVRDADHAPWREFLTAPAVESIDAHSFDTKGRLLIASTLESNASRLVAYDLRNGTHEVIAEDPMYDVGSVLTNPATHEIEAISFERERTTWTNISPDIADDVAALEQLSHGDWYVRSRDLADRQWTVDVIVDNGPARAYLYDRTARKARLLFTTQPALEEFALAKMQPVNFPARDGLMLHGYLTEPLSRQGNERVPLVLLVHGGPWARDTWGYRPDVQWLANRGYAVLQVNFRGSTGYGKNHLNAGDREWAGKMHDDLLDAKAWAIHKGIADPNKVGIYGGSYGGYAALVAVTFTPDEFACSVDIVGPSSLRTLIGSIPPYWAPALAQFHTRVGNPETEPDFLDARSPLHRAHEITTPLLIAQGANDPRVKVAESDQIVKAMRDNGKSVDYLVFPDEGHGFARPENRMKFHAAAESFLARHLGGRAQPPDAAEDPSGLLK